MALEEPPLCVQLGVRVLGKEKKKRIMVVSLTLSLALVLVKIYIYLYIYFLLDCTSYVVSNVCAGSALDLIFLETRLIK